MALKKLSSKLPCSQSGATLIEVMVTFLIVAIGLMGMAGLLSKLQASEMEAYQRTQALMILADMSNRITGNPNNAVDYVVLPNTPLGGGVADACNNVGLTTLAEIDHMEVCESLLGAGELSGVTKVGAMIGGRACIEPLAANSYLLTVAWQGMTPISAPPGSVACGAGLYDDGGACINDRCRRFVTTVVRTTVL